MASVKNPQSKPINQKRGPTTGNGGQTVKRSEFLAAKESVGNERSKLADFVMNALTRRGDGMKPSTADYAEPLDADRGPKRNPTAGGTEYNVKKSAPRKITK